jgi:hypothetical protein
LDDIYGNVSEWVIDHYQSNYPITEYNPIFIEKEQIGDDFEGSDFGDWIVEGVAFGMGPILGGNGYASSWKGDSFLGSDAPLTGSLTSPFN